MPPHINGSPEIRFAGSFGRLDERGVVLFLGGAEQATGALGARSEALEPGAYGKVGCSAFRGDAHLWRWPNDVWAVCMPSAGRFGVQREGLGRNS